MMAVPDVARLEFGDGDVEGGAKAVFEPARDLALVIERVGGFDAEFEGEMGDHSVSLAVGYQPSAVRKSILSSPTAVHSVGLFARTALCD